MRKKLSGAACAALILSSVAIQADEFTLGAKYIYTKTGLEMPKSDGEIEELGKSVGLSFSWLRNGFIFSAEHAAGGEIQLLNSVESHLLGYTLDRDVIDFGYQFEVNNVVHITPKIGYAQYDIKGYQEITGEGINEINTGGVKLHRLSLGADANFKYSKRNSITIGGHSLLRHGDDGMDYKASIQHSTLLGGVLVSLGADRLVLDPSATNSRNEDKIKENRLFLSVDVKF